MRKLYAIVFMAMLVFTGKAFAEMTYGVSAALTKVDASGSETEGGERTEEAHNTVVIPSLLLNMHTPTLFQLVLITFHLAQT